MTAAAAIRRHSLGWLVAANMVGVWLAALLLWPGLTACHVLGLSAWLAPPLLSGLVWAGALSLLLARRE